ncbi:MAG: asparagine synthase (glutamine-hydrolyzing) [Pseudohongiellaceae bacterium]|jgi:asparagine synthase (glutamine-hydrolysing)
MCGIAGFSSTPDRRPPDVELIENMLSTLIHRGPDGQNVFLDGATGLGHRRLAIIDVEGGDNPLFDNEEQVALVFNGEIYNHLELRADLEAIGARPRTGSDGEVIVHGYLAWGLMGVLRRLRGMFAIALLDRRTNDLHLARDPLGIKPLFLAENSRGVAFASEIKALFPALPHKPAYSQRGMFQSACLGYPLAPTTMFEGVESLMPGECASWSDGKLSKRKFHELVFEPGAEPADSEALWERLRESVDRHLMSEVPLGAFLSGGIDSSAVVTAMSEVVSGKVDAITVGVTDEGLDERPWAREVAEGLNVSLHEEDARSDMVSLLPQLAWHLESPFADTSAAPTWLVCQAARRHVKVALSGDGGDENFAGYRRTRYDVLEEQLRQRIPAPIRKHLLGPLGRIWPRASWLPKPLRAGTLLSNLGGDWLDGYIHSLCRIPERRVEQLLHADLRHQSPLRTDLEAAAARTSGLDPLSRVQLMDFSTWLCDDILVKVDRTSMAHSLEVRVPLLDTDFVDYAARLPTSAKLQDGMGKQLLRKALRGRVPDGVLDRPKQGFHLPVAGWLAGPCRPLLDEVIAQKNGPAFDWLDHKQLRKAADEHGRGKADRSTELWYLLTLDAFLRHGPGGSER